MTAEDAVSVHCRGSSSPFHLSPAGFRMTVVEDNEFFEALGTEEMYCQGYKTRQCKASSPRAELVVGGKAEKDAPGTLQHICRYSSTSILALTFENCAPKFTAKVQ